MQIIAQNSAENVTCEINMSVENEEYVFCHPLAPVCT